jgi:hypothetical protein
VSDLSLTPEVLERLKHLPPKALKAAMTVIGKSEWEKCAESPLYWLDATQHAGLPYVYTLDNHPLYKCLLCDDTMVPCHFNKRGIHMQTAHGVKLRTEQELRGKFKELPTTRPFTLFPYMPPIIEAWLHYPFMVVEKSRDMMATWLFVTLYTWDTLFHTGRQNIFQSEDGLKTAELVRRGKFIFDNQPKFLRQQHPAFYTAGVAKAGQLVVPSLNSEILGFPQGPDQIRQYHPTGVYTDETAFQVYAEEGFAAIAPAVRAGGRYTGVSSANPGWFQRACQDTTDGLIAE